MGKLSLKAKNPFGQDLELASGKTWLGLGAMAVVTVVFMGMVAFVRGKSGAATGSIDALHDRLRSF